MSSLSIGTTATDIAGSSNNDHSDHPFASQQDSIVQSSSRDLLQQEPVSSFRHRQQSGKPDVRTSDQADTAVDKPTIKLSHIYPIHAISRGSILSRESAAPTPSFVGFRNLAMIVLAVSNIRLVLENYSKYGVLLRFSRLGIPQRDIWYWLLLTAIIPLHLFVAIVIEKLVAIPTVKYVSHLRKSQQHHGIDSKSGKISKSSTMSLLRPKPKHLWRLIVFLHSVNAMTCLWFATGVVYYKIYNPLLGTFCEIHAVIVCLKVASYALTNRDMREAMLNSISVPEIYNTAQYPSNLTVSNLSYFWWAPTLVYQPVYPRSASFRPLFFAKRVLEMIGLSCLIWFLSAQYAVPTLENSLVHFQSLEFMGIMERLMKLASVSMAIWLAGFFCLFQSGLNALAEVMLFGDREFYEDWWNSKSVGEYWRLWNKPVTNYFRRHIYVPLVNRGWNSITASLTVFLISAVLHELAVGVPTHNIIGVAFTSMLLQIPLIQVTAPLEKMHTPSAGTIGNCIFWLSFFMGQPLGVLLYYFAWNVSMGKQKV